MYRRASAVIAVVMLASVGQAQNPLPAPQAIVSDREPSPVPADLAPIPPNPAPFGANASQRQPSNSAFDLSLLAGSDISTSSRRLASRGLRIPNMMGDFFGPGIASQQSRTFVGQAVHHITSLNDIHLIESGPSVVNPALTGPFTFYAGGPGGTGVGTFFSPPVDPPAPAFIDGLTSDVPGMFIAERTADTVDVFLDGDPPTVDIPNAAVFNVFSVTGVTIPVIGPGDLVGRMRVQDNNSAFPKDRVFLDYSYFDDARISNDGVGVNRFTPGVEKTFADGLMSVEIRTPMAGTLQSDVINGGPDMTGYELGNAMVLTKAVLLSQRDWMFVGGVGVSVPLADALSIRMQSGDELVRITNEAVHLLPYFALGWAPQHRNDFAHLFVTLDVDLNGNYTQANFNGTGLEFAGIWQDQNLLSVNAAYGSTLFEARRQCDRLQSIAWSAELHYTATLNDADVLRPGSFVLGNPDADLSLLNATIGAHAEIGMTMLSAGYVTPLTSSDRLFDGELRVLVNRRF